MKNNHTTTACRLYTIGYVYLAVLLLSACTNQESRSGTFLDDKAWGDTIVYAQTSLYEYSPYVQKRDEVLDTTFFRATFPHSKDESFNKLIFQAMGVDDWEDLERTAQLFLESYDNYIEEAPNPGLIHPWFHEIKCTSFLHTPSIIVLSTQVSEYTGGAHGNYFELLYNFDLNKLELITLKDMLGADKTKEFLNIAEKYFRDQEGLDAQVPLDKDYFFENGIFALADNFALSKDALVFKYNPYEIKPYAEGVTTLRVPYDEIVHLLSRAGKAYVQEIRRHSN